MLNFTSHITEMINRNLNRTPSSGMYNCYDYAQSITEFRIILYV